MSPFILAITPGEGFDPARWRAVLRSGVDGFLIREPIMEARELLDATRFCQSAAPEVELWVRGRLDVALAAGCGLHAPEAHPDVDPALLPLSQPLHEEAQWKTRRASRQLLISPVFASPGKGEPWGAGRLHRFLDGLPAEGPRLLALGGVEPGVKDLQHPRLDGVALVRALWGGEAERAVETLREGWK